MERSKYIASIREVLYFGGLEQILASSLQMEISLDEIANQIVNDEEIARSIKALARLLNIIEQKRTYRYLNTVRLRKETRFIAVSTKD
ncbi:MULTISPECIES: hypothetical protein [Nostoc]|uniref:Uncharacterized protein n=2 Tax=Nostoc TaxID=1177 RepID=A0ABR8I897_9NOSO|nr:MULTISPECIES: hypothetical protein [Nostoc]MBD2561718.1 hypothetical protein [Nostoc linckia FACHB-391]MBD2647121.1 hypothetical protein [Nostoc foliaceum FACHB-393]